MISGTAPREIAIINVYIPQSGRPVEERQKVFDDLYELLEHEHSKGVTIVVGDFNANRATMTQEEYERGETNAALLD
eukprot:3629597-Alexandrium_andersonii.AAC.1